MYAIIRTGGKQFRVQAGDLVRVEKLDKEPGAEFDLTDVLVVGGDKTFVGEPLLKDAKVTAVVTKQSKAAKVIVFKKKRRQGYRRMQGHRQNFTEIFIKAITSPEGQTLQAEKSAPIFDPAKREARLAKQAEERKAAKQARKKGMTTEDTRPAEKKAAGKKTAKKKTVKKAAGKKTAKKKTAKKKTAKKKTGKRTSK